MNIVLIGNVKISLAILKHIYSKNKNYICGVITNKNTKKSDYADLISFSKKKKISLFLTRNINNKKSYKWIKSIRPDLLLCVGWSQIIKKEVLSLPKKGTIGFHPTKLPNNRGKHPIIWSLILDLKKTATTFFLMNESIDGGKIISQKVVNIGKYEYVKNIYKKITQNAKKQVLDILDLIKKNKINFKSNLTNKSLNNTNYWRKRYPIDGKIDFRMNGRAIFNLVRALSHPYPGAHFEYNNINYKVFNLKFKKTNKHLNIEPGKIIFFNKKLKIKCNDGIILINKTYPNFKLNSISYI